MIIFKNKLLLAFVAVLTLSFVSADTSLELIQRECKEEYRAIREKENRQENGCPEYKKLVTCIAKVNFTAVNSFVNDHKPDNCDFSDEELQNLQKYSNMGSTTATSMTTENHGSSTRLTVMNTLLLLVLILPALCFI